MIKITDEDVKANIVCNGKYDSSVLNPFLGSVDRRYIIPVLGRDFYREIEKYGASSQQNSDVLSEILTLVQRIRVLLAFELGYDQLVVNINSFGIYRPESESQKTLYGYQERNLREGLKAEGINAVEDLLEILESNINDELLTVWADSEVCLKLKSLLINTAKEFTTYYAPLQNSRLVFLNMISSQEFIIETVIRPLLPPEKFDFIVELIKDRDILKHPQEFKLLGKINKALAFLTVADAIETLGARYNDRGLMFAESESAENAQNKSSDERSKAVAKNVKRKGDSYLSILREYLSSIGVGVDKMSTGFDVFKAGRRSLRV